MKTLIAMAVLAWGVGGDDGVCQWHECVTTDHGHSGHTQRIGDHAR